MALILIPLLARNVLTSFKMNLGSKSVQITLKIIPNWVIKDLNVAKRDLIFRGFKG